MAAGVAGSCGAAHFLQGFEEKKEGNRKKNKAPQAARWPPASYPPCAARAGARLEASRDEGGRICRRRARCPRAPLPHEDAAPGRIRCGRSRLTGGTMSRDPGDPRAAAGVGAGGKGRFTLTDAELRRFHRTSGRRIWRGLHLTLAAQQNSAPRAPPSHRGVRCSRQILPAPHVCPRRDAPRRLSSAQKCPNPSGFDPIRGFPVPAQTSRLFFQAHLDTGPNPGCDISASPSPLLINPPFN